jgi:hypothetical protein
LLQNALNDTREAPADGEGYRPPLRIVDIFDGDNSGYFVYCVGWSGTEYYRVDYSIAEDGAVTLSTPVLVNRKITYIVPSVAAIEASESAAMIEGAFVQLVERAVSNDGITRIKLIAPGVGSSGLYTEEVLRRDGPRAFPKGTKMFIDHDTAAEEAARPEGTLSRLAAVLIEDAAYMIDPKYGAGLYARAEVKRRFRDDIDDLAKDIGTSIRADGKRKMQEVNGVLMPVITQINPSNGVNNRVDFVTAPGAGGEVIALFESVRARSLDADQPQDQEDTMTPEQLAEAVRNAVQAELQPLRTQIARLEEAAVTRTAGEHIAATLAGPKYATLPERARARIAQDLALNVPMTESGALDRAKLNEAIEQAAIKEARYLSDMSGRTIGAGLGESRAPDDTDDTASAAEDERKLGAIFSSWGLTETAAKIAARGRVSA